MNVLTQAFLIMTIQISGPQHSMVLSVTLLSQYKGWGWGSVVEHLPSMCQALDSMPSLVIIKKEKEKHNRVGQ